MAKAPEVHFCNDNSEYAYVVDSTVNTNSKTITAKVPNKLLEESLPLHCYIYLTDSEDETSMKTILHIELPVNKRKKPDDYHYEDDSEVISLRDKINEIESNLDDYVLKSGSSKNLIHGTVLSNKSCTADGDASISGGKSCTANGMYATSLGVSCSADGNGAVSLGSGSKASEQGAIAAGINCVATGATSISLGYSNDVSGRGSSALGAFNTVEGNYAYIFGDGNHIYNSSSESVAFGMANNVYANSSSTFGIQNTLGDATTASSNRSAYICSFGSENKNYGGYIYSFGNSNTIGETTSSHSSNHIFAVGTSLKALGDYSFAFGMNGAGRTTVTSSAYFSFVFGSNNQAYSPYSFIFGDGNITGIEPTNNTPNPSELPYSIAIGAGQLVEGYHSLAIGTGSHIYNSAYYSYALGGLGGHSVYSPYSLALGCGCTVGIEPTTDNPSPKQNSHCYAIGLGNKTSGNLSLSFGGGCNTTGNYSLAFGTGSSNSGNWSVAIGSGTNVEANYSFGFGNEGVHICSGASNSIALMSGTKVYSGESAAIGCGSVAGDSKNDETQSLTPSCFAFGSVCTSKGGYGSLATGYTTIASSKSQFVTGKYNREDTNNKYGFILGNGNYDSDAKKENRSNAIAVDWQGKIYVNNSDTGVDVLDLLNRVKALEEALDGLKLKKTTTSEYDSLETKDDNTVYFCTE